MKRLDKNTMLAIAQEIEIDIKNNDIRTHEVVVDGETYTIIYKGAIDVFHKFAIGDGMNVLAPCETPCCKIADQYNVIRFYAGPLSMAVAYEYHL